MAVATFLPVLNLAQGIVGNLFGKGTGSSIGGFVADVTISEQHTKEADPTENPVEEGVVITDHIDLKPDVVTLHGVVSNNPINLGSALQGLAVSGGALVGQQIGGGLGAAIGGTAAGAIIGLLKSPENRALNAYQHLADLQRKRVPFTVITGFEKYDNMMITNISCTRDVKSGQVFDFTATMRQIRIVENKTVKLPNVRKGIHGAGTKADLGHQTGQTPTPNNDTLTLSLFKSVGIVGK